MKHGKFFSFFFFLTESNADQLGAPSETGAESNHQSQIAPLESSASESLIQTDRNRSRRGIAVFIHIDKKLVVTDIDTMSNSFNDPLVCLMGDDQLQVADIDSGFFAI